MSNVARVAGQAANTLVKPLEVEQVFSTYLYDGSNTLPLVQTTGIDGSEGALVWIKQRNAARQHILFDTEQDTNLDSSNTRAGQTTHNTTITSTGFSLNNGDAKYNDGTTPGEYASWTFRKAPKFFDVVTYTGDGTSGQTINHNLGTNVGAIIIKCTDTNTNWAYWHRTFGSQEMIIFNSTGASRTDLPYVSNVTDSSFTVNGSSSFVNENTKSHVAYLFAHNDGDGEFGPDGDADIIKCGSYTGNGSTDGPEIDLGFEPQWVMIKRTDSTADWVMQDVMRGMIMDSGGAYIKANDLAAEFSTTGYIQPEPSGFKVRGTGSSQANASGGNYIYIAIRRPTAVPTSATEVFASDFARAAADGNKPEYRSGFPVDTRLTLYRPGGSSSYPAIGSRITGNEYLVTSSTAAGGAWTAQTFDYMNGFMNTAASVINTTLISHMWKRAPNFFDVVAYTGTGSTRTVAHNLGAAPEMMWFKGRNQSAYNWMVYHKNISPANGIYLSDSGAAAGASFQFANTAPTATVFTVSSGVDVNSSNEPYIAYLFATLPGISKVGSYTGTGATLNIDCGFTSGARFVLLKRTDSTGEWRVFDTARGIIAGNDPLLNLNSTGPEEAFDDLIDPYSAGFSLTGSGMVNTSGGSYIFYAIA